MAEQTLYSVRRSEVKVRSRSKVKMRHRPELKKGRGRNKMEEGCGKGGECRNMNVGSFFFGFNVYFCRRSYRKDTVFIQLQHEFYM